MSQSIHTNVLLLRAADLLMLLSLLSEGCSCCSWMEEKEGMKGKTNDLYGRVCWERQRAFWSNQMILRNLNIKRKADNISPKTHVKLLSNESVHRSAKVIITSSDWQELSRISGRGLFHRLSLLTGVDWTLGLLNTKQILCYWVTAVSCSYL